MHYQYWPLTVNVPASTGSGSPVTVNWPIVQGHLKRIEIQIPAGHHGNTGIKIRYHQQQIYPWANNYFLVESGGLRTAEWDDEIMGTGLDVQAYNTDIVSHRFFLLAEIWPSVEPLGSWIDQSAQARNSAPEYRERIAVLRSPAAAA